MFNRHHNGEPIMAKFLYYGLMKRGEFNYQYLQHILNNFIAVGTLNEYAIHDMDGGCGINKRDGCKVVGDVFEIDEKYIEQLDSYERAYSRELLDVILEDGHIIKCFVYVHKFDLRQFPIVKSGVWTQNEQHV